MSKLNFDGPVVLVVMDGVGLRDNREGNAVKQAHLETLNYLMDKYPTAKLGAAGEYVGVPKDDMGNSEVGHNAMGAGEIVLQRSAAVENDVNTGKIFETQTWQDIVARIHERGSTLHFMGIFSDGNVHSNIAHLEKMLAQAQKDGINRVRVHTLIDGRDVPPHSEPKYIQRLEKFVHDLGDPDYKIASGGGRMVITCDRYENDWPMVEKGWHTHVLGEGRQFASATEAIETFRAENKDLQDQYMPAFVIADDGEPIGKMRDGDACIYIDFRADRAMRTSSGCLLCWHDGIQRGPSCACPCLSWLARIQAYLARISRKQRPKAICYLRNRKIRSHHLLFQRQQLSCTRWGSRRRSSILYGAI